MQFATATLSPPTLFFAPREQLIFFNPRTPISLSEGRAAKGVALKSGGRNQRHDLSLCATRLGARRKFISVTSAATSGGGDGGSVPELDDNARKLLQALLWIAEGVYIIWLFLLPYAPGDPVWAISSETIDSLIGLSLNFFFVLPLSNSDICLIISILIFIQSNFGRVVGIHLIEAPVLHPMSEGLFNFVIGWTLMFAPLLYTDKRRERYKGSLDVLWGFQMFLTNTFLIPYMAIRLNEADEETKTPRKISKLGSIMMKGAPVVGLVGGFVCLFSILWGVYGRNGNFGDLAQRWEFLVSYLGSERLAYAFVWDICLYVVFQTWLIGDNLQNVRKDKVGLVRFLRFVPVVGLTAYCLCLNADNES